MWIDAKGSAVLPAPECKRLLAVAGPDRAADASLLPFNIG
jgi:hypothetical protein